MAIDASKGMQQGEETYTDTSCDIVVIGAGGAGLSAATQAASMGAHVIVLEKPLSVYLSCAHQSISYQG